MATAEEPPAEEAPKEVSKEEEPVSEEPTAPTAIVGPLAAPGAHFQLVAKLDAPNPDTSPKCQEARKLFERGLATEHKVFVITIRDANDKQLQERVKKKMELADKTQGFHDDAIDKKCPRWTTAALLHIGLQYANFAETIMESPVPSKLSDEQTRIYCGALFDQAERVYRKSTPAWEQTLEVSEETGEQNEWTQQASRHLEAGKMDKQTEVDACVARK